MDSDPLYVCLLLKAACRKVVMLGGIQGYVVHAVSSRGSAVTSFLICTGRTNPVWIPDVSDFRVSNARLRLMPLLTTGFPVQTLHSR